MTASDPGFSGALAGLALGAVEFVVAMAATRRVLAREMEEEGDMPGLAFVAGRLRSIRLALAGFSFVGLPALGYALGTTLAHNGGAR
jgi:hypothetical protein